MKELILKANTEITENNLPDFAKELRKVLSTVNTDLKTDEDFAEAKDLVKKFDKSEKALKAAKERIFESGELSKINKLINELSAECRDVRLTLNRTVTAKEKEVKQGLIEAARETLISASKNSVMYAYLDIDWSDIADQIKGKKLLSKMEEALNTYVGVKINAIQVQETALLSRLKLIESMTKGNEALFNTETLMRDDDFEETIKSRIQANDEAIAEKARIEAERLVEEEKQAEAREQQAQQVAKQKANDLARQKQQNNNVERYLNDQENHSVAFHNQVKDLDKASAVDVDAAQVTRSREIDTNMLVGIYRVRLDVTCSLEEAKSIANELKIDYSRLNAVVSLNRVNSEKVA